MKRQADLEQANEVKNIWSRRRFTVARFYLGIDYLKAGKKEKSMSCFKQSIDELNELREEQPRFLIIKTDLAEAYNFLGNIQKDDGDSEEAIKNIKSAMEKWRELLRIDPNQSVSIARLSTVDFELGKYLVSLVNCSVRGVINSRKI